MKQLCITPSMGKRLIGKAMVYNPEVKRVLEEGTLVITAGTTNGYVAEELLKSRLSSLRPEGFVVRKAPSGWVLQGLKNRFKPGPSSSGRLPVNRFVTCKKGSQVSPSPMFASSFFTSR